MRGQLRIGQGDCRALGRGAFVLGCPCLDEAGCPSGNLILTLIPRAGESSSLASLYIAGFDSPTLFIHSMDISATR